MALTLAHVRALVAVADRASFTEAATDLGISQSAVSHAVLGLEKEIGGRVVLINEYTRVMPAEKASANAANLKKWEGYTNDTQKLGGEIAAEAAKGAGADKAVLGKKLKALDASCTACLRGIAKENTEFCRFPITLAHGVLPVFDHRSLRVAFALGSRSPDKPGSWDLFSLDLDSDVSVFLSEGDRVPVDHSSGCDLRRFLLHLLESRHWIA